MLHPRLTPLGATPGGSSSVPLSTLGEFGSWGDLAYSFRWGQGASGMFEASWTMPLPGGFAHPLLRRGTLVELMDGLNRVGSPLVMSEPGRGTGLGDPWQITCTGVGREVEGENAWYMVDGSDDATVIASVAIDNAISEGLPWAGRHSSVPTTAFGEVQNDLQSIGAHLSAYGDSTGQRWGVDRDSIVRFMSDPVEPKYQLVPGAASLGQADDNYASVVLVRYPDSTAGTFKTVRSPATPSPAEQRYGRRTLPVTLTDQPPMSAATAQSFADGILAKYGGRLSWTNGLTGLTKYDLMTMGNVPADLSQAAEDVGSGCMVRLHGVWDDLLEFTGNTFLDVIIGEAKLTDGGQTIDLNPLGLAPRDLAAVVESITGIASAA